jgi:hypothetical protein
MSTQRNSDPHSSNIIYYVKKHWKQDTDKMKINIGLRNYNNFTLLVLHFPALEGRG